MGRVALFIFAAVAGYALFADGTGKDFVPTNLAWAALLPAIYILGLAFVKD